MFRCYQTHSPPGLPVTTLLLRSFEHSSLQFCTSQTLWLVPPKDVYIQPRMALPSSANRTAPQRTSTSTLYLDHHCLLLGKPTCISTRFPLMVAYRPSVTFAPPTPVSMATQENLRTKYIPSAGRSSPYAQHHHHRQRRLLYLI